MSTTQSKRNLSKTLQTERGYDAGTMSHFASTILKNKQYTHDLGNGNYESWPQAAERVVRSVMQPYLPELVERTLKLVTERKFIPGGRYLYASGRKFPCVNNCFLFSCQEDTRQEWGRIADKSINALMCGGGVGVVYSKLRAEDSAIGGLGGKSTGPCALMRMVNENGRYIRQGGSRRSAIWAGLHWNHLDIFKFIGMKDWNSSIRKMREEDFTFPAPMDGTNVSVILDDLFFAAYNDPKHALYELACNVYWTSIRHMLRTGEPGFSIDIGENSGEHLRNACLTGDTMVATADGSGAVPISDLVGKSTRVYAPDSQGNIKIGTLRNIHVSRRNAPIVRVTIEDGSSVRLTADHQVMLQNGSFVEAGSLIPGMRLMPFSSRVANDYRWVGCRKGSKKACWLAMGRVGGEGDGYDVHHVNENKLDDRLENLQLIPHGEHKRLSMIGAKNPSVRIGYDDEWRVRQSIKSTGASNGRYKDGSRTHRRNMADEHQNVEGSRRTWKRVCLVCKEEFNAKSPEAPTCGRSCGAKLGNKNKISYKGGRTVVSVEPCGREDVYDGTVDGLDCFAIVTTPSEHLDLEHGSYAGMVVHNCTEVTSSTDGDMCNLGSINMGRLKNQDEFLDLVECGTAFLLCGTLYSKLPLDEMYAVRDKNRRIGLGLMGVHEWLLRREMTYKPCEELKDWMEIYKTSGSYANHYADKLGISRPIATRSIAPTGTISIIAETTSGIEPIYAVAYKRRYLEGIQWKAQYVIENAAKRIIEAGINPELIEDSYTLAEDVERRVAFQGWMQRYVDHGISSTINLPPWGSELNNEGTVTQFGNRLMKYLPELRGITAYPDGCRGGQPLNRVSYTEAVKHVGVSFVEETEHGNENSCKGGVCGE